MGLGERANPTLDGFFERGSALLVARQTDNRLHDRQCIAGAVIDLTRKQALLALGFLAIGQIDGHAVDPFDSSGLVEGGGGCNQAISLLSVGPEDRHFRLDRVVRWRGIRCRFGEALPLGYKKESLQILSAGTVIVGVGSESENTALSLVPVPAGGRVVVLPRAHIAGGERQAAPAFALHEPLIGRSEFGGPFRNALLERAVEGFELAGLPI